MTKEIFLSGSEELLKPVITMLLGINQLLDGKDIGQFVGEPIEENVKALPHTLRMKLIWYGKKEPPYTAAMGMKLVKAEAQIPDVDTKKLDWTTIKQIMGGDNGYIWGRYVATVNLDNGRQMQCYGSTKEEADNQLSRNLLLTKAKVLTSGVTELKKEGRRAAGQSMEINSIRVYPAYCVLVNSKRILRVEDKAIREELATKRRSKLRGDYLEKGSERIPMYVAKAPKNFKQIVNNALRFGDDD